MTMIAVFPGQGSQSKGMLAEWLTTEPVVRDTFTEASDLLGYDMQALVSDDAEGLLAQTMYTQPALLTASIALWRVWLQRGGAQPACFAGHSLGEYSALVAASSLRFADAIPLVAFRGQAMMNAVSAGVGKMAAILGLDDAKLEALCAEVSENDSVVWAANYNCPGQLVVAGHASAVDRLMLAASDAGARRTLPLAVSAPSHTPLMHDAAMAMRERLAQVSIADPCAPVWSNASADVVRDAASIREALVEQLVAPVRWTSLMQHAVATGVDSMLELGPGKVLSGLMRRIDRSVTIGFTETPAAFLAAGAKQ